MRLPHASPLPAALGNTAPLSKPVMETTQKIHRWFAGLLIQIGGK
jgi:hypothetical protein